MGVLVTFEADGSARDGGGVTSADFGSPEDMVFGCTVMLCPYSINNSHGFDSSRIYPGLNSCADRKLSTLFWISAALNAMVHGCTSYLKSHIPRS